MCKCCFVCFCRQSEIEGGEMGGRAVVPGVFIEIQSNALLLNQRCDHDLAGRSVSSPTHYRTIGDVPTQHSLTQRWWAQKKKDISVRDLRVSCRRIPVGRTKTSRDSLGPILEAPSISPPRRMRPSQKQRILYNDFFGNLSMVWFPSRPVSFDQHRRCCGVT